MCAKSKNVGLRLGLRLGMRLESWVYDWVCDWEPLELSPLPESPRDLSPSAPLLPLSERTPLLEFCNVPGAGALLDVCKNSWSGRPSSFFPNSRSGRPSPILLSSRCGRPSSIFAKFPERTPLLAFANSQSGRPSHPNVYNTRTGIPVSAKKTPARIPQSAKFNYPRAPQLQCWTSDATHGRAEAGVFFAAPQRPPAATTTLNLGVRGSLRQCA